TGVQTCALPIYQVRLGQIGLARDRHPQLPLLAGELEVALPLDVDPLVRVARLAQRRYLLFFQLTQALRDVRGVTAAPHGRPRLGADIVGGEQPVCGEDRGVGRDDDFADADAAGDVRGEDADRTAETEQRER